MKNSPLKEKSYQFALRVTKLCRFLTDEQKEYVLSRRIMDSGTLIASHLEQAFQGDSSNDFLHHLFVALQKSYDSHFWLRLLRDSGYLTEKQTESMLIDCEELQKLLTSSIKTTRKRLSGEQ